MLKMESELVDKFKISTLLVVAEFLPKQPKDA